MILMKKPDSAEIQNDINNVTAVFGSKTVFDSQFPPITFSPLEQFKGVTYQARQILCKRVDKDIIKISKALGWILQVGEKQLQRHAMELITKSSVESVRISQGKAVYLLRDVFDLSTLPIDNLSWGEIFATLALSQAAQATVISRENLTGSDLANALNRAGKKVINELEYEVIDSISRAECLYDFGVIAKTSNAKGGRKRAEKYLPLKWEVGLRYVRDYNDFNNKKAAVIIEQELIDEKSKLLNLSSAEDKSLQFAKWISELNANKWALPIDLDRN